MAMQYKDVGIQMLRKKKQATNDETLSISFYYES